MLSIQQCKNHIGKCNFTDQQIEEMRDNFYQLANIFVKEYLQNKKEYFSLISQNKVTKI